MTKCPHQGPLTIQSNTLDIMNIILYKHQKTTFVYAIYIYIYVLCI